MFSKLRPTLCYKNLSPEIANHDQDIDADEWDYNGRVVYRGIIDHVYDKYGLSVYWLYDSDLKRVGLSEHEKENEEKFEALWFRENDFSTLLQEDWVSLDKTIWSSLSAEAYQDCLEDDFETVIERTKNGPYCLVFPNDVLKAKKIELPVLFLDDSFILYDFPIHSRVWDLLGFTQPFHSQESQSDASAEVQVEVQVHPHPLDQEPQTESPPEEQETVQEQE